MDKTRNIMHIVMACLINTDKCILETLGKMKRFVKNTIYHKLYYKIHLYDLYV